MGNFGFQEILLLLVILVPAAMLVYYLKNKSKPPVNAETTEEESLTGEDTEDKLSIGLKILSFFIPLAGAIIYFSYREKYPNKADAACYAALLGLVIGVVLRVLVTVNRGG